MKGRDFDQALSRCAAALAVANDRSLFGSTVDCLLYSGRIGSELGPPRLLMDVTLTNKKDVGTGIQRVVRSVAHTTRKIYSEKQTLFEPLAVRLDLRNICEAESFRLGDKDRTLKGKKISLRSGDNILMVDASWHLFEKQLERFELVRAYGGRIFTIIYDIVPLLYPDTCSETTMDIFDHWFRNAIRWSDGIICISRAVADEVETYVRQHGLPFTDGLKIGWFHLGSDILPPMETIASRDDLNDILASEKPTFLMVGTLEPRKRHAVVLDAMERLWRANSNARLLIIGKHGWGTDEFVGRLNAHPEIGRRLFWIEGANDADLSEAYRRTSALVFASIYEGYGLPIAEAARAELPILCSDIPVHREVAGDGAAYFKVDDSESLSQLLRDFLDGKTRPDPSLVNSISWRESCEQLLDVIYGHRWHRVLRWPDYVDDNEQVSDGHNEMHVRRPKAA